MPNDSLFGLQYALNMDDTLTGINIQSAWDIETGKQFIKVAVHDTGIDTLHPDLNIVFGGAYNPNNYAEAPWGLNEDSHGTGVAGIIGAKRNNAMGIAGVAGGNGSDTSGVSLFDLKIMPNSFGLGSYFMAGVVDAARSVGTYWDYSDIYSIESQNYFNNSPGFGVHIGNHSYTISTEIPTQMPNGRDIPVNDENVDADCQVCREAMLFSLRNGVINVVCRFNGFNTANPPTPVTRIDDLYPQSLPDNWIISVGASGSDGNTVQDGVNQAPGELSFYSLYGGNMDLIAPGSKGNVYTTRATTSGLNYDVFNGTSAAAPYVSGAIGLLLSHYNKACYNRRNLSIEDIEYILEKSTTPLNAPGYDELSGWGRLNVRKALDMIETPIKQIVHPDSLVSSVIVQRDTIALAYREAFVADGWGPISQGIPLERNKQYEVERVLMENTYSYAQFITPTTQVLDFWARPSASNSIEFYRDTIYGIAPLPTGTLETYKFEFINLTPFDTIVEIDTVNYLVKTRGYYYHFIGQYPTLQVNANGVAQQLFGTGLYVNPATPINSWFPSNPIDSLPNMYFSLYLSDSSLTSIYDYPCDSINLIYDQYAGLAEETEMAFAYLSPNPTSNTAVLVFPSLEEKKRITIYSVHGEIIQEHFTQKTSIELNLADQPKGLYLVVWESENRTGTFKLIKQ